MFVVYMVSLVASGLGVVYFSSADGSDRRRERRDLRPLRCALRDRVQTRKARHGPRARQHRNSRAQPDHHVYRSVDFVAGARRRFAGRLRAHVRDILSAATRRAGGRGREDRPRTRNGIRNAGSPVNRERKFSGRRTVRAERCPASSRAPDNCRWRSSSSAASWKGCTRSSRPERASGNRWRIWCRRFAAGRRSCSRPARSRCKSSSCARTFRSWRTRSACRCASRCSKDARTICAGRSSNGCARIACWRRSRSMQQIWEWAERTANRRSRRAGLRAARATSGSSSTPMPTNAWASICAHFRNCFFFEKRDEAKYADLVVVNHALFFLDLAVGGGLLPPYDVAVLDEAHQCERWATDALTAVLSRSDDRPHAAQAAPRLRRAVGLRCRVRRGDAAAGVGAWRACRATVIRWRQTRTRGRRWSRCARRSTAWRTGSSPTAVTALKKRVENEAEAERRRDLALRAVLAHER